MAGHIPFTGVLFGPKAITSGTSWACGTGGMLFNIPCLFLRLSQGTWTLVPDNAAGVLRNLLSNWLSVSLKVPKKVFQQLQLVGNLKLPVESILYLG